MIHPPCTHRTIFGLAITAIVVIAFPRSVEGGESTRPNVVVLLVDDWGWTDAGCLGSDLYETPNIDELFAESVRFDNAYSACSVCSPTRAALLTGKYPARLHLTNYIPGKRQPDGPLREPNWTKCLEHRHVTLAEALGADGYRTAHVGKWHLTPYNQKLVDRFLPDAHGFEVNIGGGRAGQPGSYFHPYTRAKLSVGPLPPGGKEGDYLTDRLTDEAIELMHGWREEPFFIYLAYYAVHTPIQPKIELREHYADRVSEGARHTNPSYAAMVQSLDESVGSLRQALEDLDIEDDTILVLTSDNGGVLGNITNNAPLRSGKSSEFEGGVRVPMMVHWPMNADHGQTCSEPVITMDIYPTVLEVAGAAGDATHNKLVDGKSLVPLLEDPSAQLNREAIYWHYPHYQGTKPYGAVRSGAWRLIEYFEDGRLELYNLDDDIGETNNLASDLPERAKTLRKMLHEWREEVGADMPSHVPGYTATISDKRVPN